MADVTFETERKRLHASLDEQKNSRRSSPRREVSVVRDLGQLGPRLRRYILRGANADLAIAKDCSYPTHQQKDCAANPARYPAKFRNHQLPP